MAYETIGTVTRYTWLSSETKPVGANDGSTGFERDTGKNYVYSTISGWVPAAMPVVPFNSSGTEILPATATLQGTGNTALSNILTKLIAAPATEAKQDTGNSSLASIVTNTGASATQTTAAAILAALSSGLISLLTSQAITANTDILATAFTATKTGTSVLMISVAAAGILSLKVNGVLSTLFNGDTLDAGKWYECEIVIVDDSTYNLQYSVSDTIQLQWVVR